MTQVHNAGIAEIFNRVADLLEIENANTFRVRAYRNAARVIEGWPQSLTVQIAQGARLPHLQGVGADLDAKIHEIVATGKLALLTELEKRVHPELRSLLALPGLGPKRVRALREHYAVLNLDRLEKLARAGKIRTLPGFGLKSEQKLLAEIPRARLHRGRVRLPVALQIAEPLLKYLKKTPGVTQAIVAGSLRRSMETIGDLDVLVTAAPDCPVMARFLAYDEVESVLAQGKTKSIALLTSGIQVDVRVVPVVSYGAALLYFTGSKAHNIALRGLARRKGYKINEYGVFKGTRRVAGRTEAEIYAKLGLEYVEPELRENRGEIEAARLRLLPQLVQLSDIRGDLHAHTKATDGQLTLESLALAAEMRGYEYLAITDHTQHLTVAHGQDPRRIRQQLRAIDRVNAGPLKIRLLKAAEVDILEDGSLDLPNEVLAQLDLTVCSVHSKFNLPRARQTERIIRAMDNPYFKILGHPTGRLLGSRHPYDVDIELLIKAARERGCALELNAQPERLDLSDIFCKMAKEQGVKIAVSTDTHGENDLSNMRFGVAQARRGWLEKKDVLNTLPLNELLKRLQRQ